MQDTKEEGMKSNILGMEVLNKFACIKYHELFEGMWHVLFSVLVFADVSYSL